jgi:expansin
MKHKIIFLLSLFFYGFAYTQTISCGNEQVYTGEGTYYDIAQFGNFGNCSFPNSMFQPFLIGAMNASQYGLADFCGSCAKITGPKGSVTVHIIDQCPECKQGDIDLSPAAFDYLAPRIDGRIPISWHLVPCQNTGNIQFYIKEGSSQYWTAVQVRNHKNKITKFEYLKNNAYVQLPRQDYNYFLASSGMGVGPYTIRLTDVYGNQIVEQNIPLTLTTVLNGTKQFPACPITGLESNENVQFYTLLENGIEFEKNQNYQILDLNGKEILSGKAETGDLLELKSGFYIIKSLVSNTILTEKIIIE